MDGLPGASDYLYSRLTHSDAGYFLVLKLDRVGGRLAELSGKDIVVNHAFQNSKSSVGHRGTRKKNTQTDKGASIKYVRRFPGFLPAALRRPV